MVSYSINKDIAVVVATKHRPAQLLNMILSVPIDVLVYVYAYDDLSVPESIGSFDNVSVYVGKKSIIEANNFLIEKAYNDNEEVSVLTACDDIVYNKDLFKVVIDNVNEDNTYLYGLQCSNMQCKNDAFVCISNKIIKETDCKPYDERYYHFYADTQLGDLYKHLGRFKVLDAYLENFHPVITGIYDKTHTEGRSEKLFHDKEIYENSHILHARV